MKEKIVWGMIGCGDVTEVKNGPGLYLASDSVLKGVWNRTREKAENWVKRHQAGTVYDSLESLISDPEIDIIYISTTPDTHKDFAIRCAEKGKHVLLEKPVTGTFEDGLEIRNAFEKANKKCFVAFYRRKMNRFLRLFEILQSGEIGDVMAVQMYRSTWSGYDSSNWRNDPSICQGDTFTETEIHALDIMSYILGPISQMMYMKDPVKNTYTLNAKFNGGKVSTGFWNYQSEEEKDVFTVFGLNGKVEFSFFNNSSPLKISGINGYREEVISDSIHVGLNMEQEIVNELLGKGSFSGTLDAALETLQISSKMYFG